MSEQFPNRMINIKVNDMIIKIEHTDENIDNFKRVLNTLRQLSMDHKKLKSENYKLSEAVSGYEKSISEIRREGVEIKKKLDSALLDNYRYSVTHKLQLETIEKLKTDLNKVSNKLHLQNSLRLQDKEQYDIFKYEYERLTHNTEAYAEQIKALKKKYDDVKYQLIVAHWGSERVKLSLKIESLEVEISRLQSEHEKSLLDLDREGFYKKIFSMQTEQVQSTMIRLGWLDADMSFEYRVGLMYDTARAHNLRNMLSLADGILKKNLRLVRTSECVQKPLIPYRSTIMRESLRQDIMAKDMSKISTIYRPELSTLFMDLSVTSDDINFETQFPKLPTLESLDTQESKIEQREIPKRQHKRSSYNSDINWDLYE